MLIVPASRDGADLQKGRFNWKRYKGCSWVLIQRGSSPWSTQRAENKQPFQRGIEPHLRWRTGSR